MHKSIIALIVTIVLWSSGYVAIRFGLKGYNPGSFALLHYLISSIGIVLPFVLLKGRSRISLLDLSQFLLMGMIGFGVYNIALNYGETTVDAGVTSFINSQIPLTILFISMLFLREKVTLQTFFGIVVSCLGVSLIAYGYSEHADWKTGIIYLLTANSCAALYTIFCKQLLKKYHPLEVTAYTTWGGTLMLIFYVPELWRDIQTAAMTATTAAIYLGIFPGILGYLSWNYTLQYFSAVRASRYLYIMPLVTTMMGWCLLNEAPTLLTLTGGFIAVAGAMIHEKIKPAILMTRNVHGITPEVDAKRTNMIDF